MEMPLISLVSYFEPVATNTKTVTDWLPAIGAKITRRPFDNVCFLYIFIFHLRSPLLFWRLFQKQANQHRSYPPCFPELPASLLQYAPYSSTSKIFFANSASIIELKYFTATSFIEFRFLAAENFVRKSQ